MLKAVVGIMGVLIVLGTAVVVGTIVHRLYANAQRPSMAAGVVPPPEGSVPPAGASVGTPAGAPALLPAGAHIAGIAAAGDGVAVWISGPGGDQLWLVDPRTGAHDVLVTAAGGGK
jgi:hypothetical protein